MLDTYRYKVDFREVKYYIEIHEVLKRDLEFPDYYGGDLDALWDCLTDMLGDISIIEIYNSEAISKKYPGTSYTLAVENELPDADLRALLKTTPIPLLSSSTSRMSVLTYASPESMPVIFLVGSAILLR